MIWPVCRCHQAPMSRNGPKWLCTPKKRARELAHYHAMTASQIAHRLRVANVARRKRWEETHG